MRTIIILLCLVVLITLCASAPAGIPPSHAHRHKAGVPPVSRPNIAWQTDIPTAFRQAKKQHKAIFLEVSTDWCGYCAVMDRSVFPDTHVRALVHKFIPLKINPEKSMLARAMVHQLGFRAYPSFAFVKYNGDLISTTTGYQSVEQMQALLQRALQQAQ